VRVQRRRSMKRKDCGKTDPITKRKEEVKDHTVSLENSLREQIITGCS